MIAEADVEQMIRSCEVPRNLFTDVIPRPSLVYMSSMVQGFVIDAALLPDPFSPIAEAEAQTYLARSLVPHRGRLGRFKCICAAYDVLLGENVGADMCPSLR